MRVFFASYPFQHLLFLLFLIIVNSNRCEMISHYSFDLHFPNNEWHWTSFHVSIDHLFYFEKYLFKSFTQYLVGLFVFLLLNCVSSYILYTHPLLNIWFANNFSHSVGCLFVLIMVSFTVWQLIKQLDVIPFVYFCFHFPCFGTRFTKRCEWHYHLHILLGILWFKLLHSSL